MFPRPNRPDRPAHAWLDAVRHGLDLLVAFATLRDAEAPPEYDETAPGAGVSWPRADAIAPITAAGRRAAERAKRHAADGWDRRAPDHSDRRLGDHSDRRPADRAKTPAPPHPHRRPVRPAPRVRRPGAVRPEPQLCLTPIVPRRARPTRAPARGARH
jgi:hypothetical protein